jgi:ubiquinone/menaquinone biosynthesis C-methylase UbiE
MQKVPVSNTIIKKSAISFFDDYSSSWADRYSDRGTSASLWERHNAILDLIAEARLPKSSEILDVGCGAGYMTFDLAKRGYHGVGIDAARKMVETCIAEGNRRGISQLWQYKEADAEQIPYPEKSFDAVICCGVIEYLPSDEELLREVRRLLRPNGVFILCVTNKYGYSRCLYPIFQRTKKIPGFIKMATKIRAFSTGRKSELMNLPFRPRSHSPAHIRRLVAAHGFKLIRDKYINFTVLPGPFDILLSVFTRGISSKLDKLDGTLLRVLGSSYLMTLTVD